METSAERRVRLTAYDPDPGYRFPTPPGGWPTLTGRLVASVEGLYGKRWYLMELDRPIVPKDFDTLHLRLIPEPLASTPSRYLLLSPTPPMATLEIPPDYIGSTLARREIAWVYASLGPSPHNLPSVISLDVKRDQEFHGLFAATLELL